MRETTLSGTLDEHPEDDELSEPLMLCMLHNDVSYRRCQQALDAVRQKVETNDWQREAKKLYEGIVPEYKEFEEKRAEARASAERAAAEKEDLETKLEELDSYFEEPKTYENKELLRPTTSDDRIEARKELERF